MIVEPLGRLDYQAGIRLQHAHRKQVMGGAADRLLLLEHDAVVTLGRRGGQVDRRALAAQGTRVIQTDRGGLATWHGPGQLVGYPIVDLRRRRQSVPEFVAALGALMVAVAARLGVTDVSYDACRPGVYRQERKLGSIGLHLSRGVTTHGFALNVDNDLAGFGAITPCGFATLQVSTLAAEAPSDVAVIDLAAAQAATALLAPELLA